MIDNGLGVGVGMAGKKGSSEYNEMGAYIVNSKIYGESPAHDCPQQKQGGYCFRMNKCGLMASTFSIAENPFHPTSPSPKPNHV